MGFAFPGALEAREGPILPGEFPAPGKADSRWRLAGEIPGKLAASRFPGYLALTRESSRGAAGG